MKPTLIKTTCPELAAAVSKECAKDHLHEHLQGAATAASQEYPPRMASAIASVVLPEGSRSGARQPTEGWITPGADDASSFASASSSSGPPGL